ncbi:hypothetical protein ABES21_24155 [Peribacillus frigoritolerans]|uniref:hypothetical protein n=1 Tax=Peribacillus frigoritolerans TaxID=450367 RepID=UPI003D2BFBC8
MKKKNKNVLTNTIEHVYVPYALVAAITSPVVGWILVKEKGVDFGDLGTFGDFLGGSTVPLLTFITILLLIRTIRIQSNQLDVQKDEFTLLREEMASTKEALQEQGKTAKIQRFENSFFIQINELRSIKSKIEIEFIEMNDFTDEDGNSGIPRLPYKEIMVFLDTQIDSKVFANKEGVLRGSNIGIESSSYLGNLHHKLTMENHILSNNIVRMDTFSTYHFIIARIVILIFHNKEVMDKWELDYYLEYILEEITHEGMNLVLLQLASSLDTRRMVKELDLHNERNVYGPNWNIKYKLFDYLINRPTD